MSEVMLDIETLSVAPNATILTIGAIKFSRTGNLKSMDQYEQFYIRVDPKSCESLGSYTDPSTVKWWESQSKEAYYEAIEHPDRVPIEIALKELSKWIGNSKIIWANSPSFDCVILETAYRQCGIQVPWKFWLIRYTRTLFDLAGVKKNDLPDNGEHHALYDCYRQIVGVKRSLKKLNL